MRQLIGLFSLVLLFPVMPSIAGVRHHAAQVIPLPERIAQNTLPSPEPLPPSLVSPTSATDPIEAVVAAGLMTRDANGSFTLNER